MIRTNKGMTLIEIMIVLIIVGSLMAILGSTVVGRLKSANVKTTKIAMTEIMKALDLYYADCGTYPQDLGALVEKPSDCSNWGPEPYIKKVHKDAWNSEFVYEPRGSTFVLKSLGNDKREGGSGVDADLSSEEM